MNKKKFSLNRRKFLTLAGTTTAAVGSNLFLGVPTGFGKEKPKMVVKPKTNYDKMKNVPRTKFSLPGLYPGKVTEVVHSKVWKNENEIDANILDSMMKSGMEDLTGKEEIEGWKLFFSPDDIVGIKVNPVGENIISTRLELVDSVIEKLVKAGVPKKNIVIWDRFEGMLKAAGFTKERFPGVQIEGMQMMDMKGGETWKGKDGKHISEKGFDMNMYYWVDAEAPKTDEYLNMHVFNGKYSYYGNLITKKLTKIINLPAMKNTGNGVSMATKNIGYAAVANTNRLHKPMFFDVCVEVLGFPVVRDKLVLNILEGLKGQYEGGPMANAKYVYKANKLMFATDPFAQDYIGYLEMLKKRKADPNVKVNNSPRYIDYIKYAEREGLGIANPKKIKHKVIKLG